MILLPPMTPLTLMRLNSPVRSLIDSALNTKSRRRGNRCLPPPPQKALVRTHHRLRLCHPIKTPRLFQLMTPDVSPIFTEEISFVVKQAIISSLLSPKMLSTNKMRGGKTSSLLGCIINRNSKQIPELHRISCEFD